MICITAKNSRRNFKSLSAESKFVAFKYSIGDFFIFAGLVLPKIYCCQSVPVLESFFYCDENFTYRIFILINIKIPQSIEERKICLVIIPAFSVHTNIGNNVFSDNFSIKKIFQCKLIIFPLHQTLKNNFIDSEFTFSQ